MTKTTIFGCLLAATLAAVLPTGPHAGASAEEKQGLEEKQSLEDKLVGAWGLVGPPAAEGEPDKSRLKFWGHGHWSTTQINPETGDVLYHHGGTYTLDGNEYTEKIRYAVGASASQLGRVYRFKIEVKGDTFIQTGIDNPYSEKWVRLRSEKD